MAARFSYTVKFIYNLAIFCCCIGLFSCGKVDTKRCPTNLPRDRYLRVHRDKCYRFITNEVSWPSARDHCRRTGGQLITITRRDIQLFVEQTLREIWSRNGMWIGAHDRDSEMDWFWVTGEKVRSSFQNWDTGQPSCFLPNFLCHEDCACLRLDKGYQWHDYLCSSSMYKYGYACQYNLLPPPKTTPTTTAATTSTTPTTTTSTSTTTPSTTVLPTKTPTTTETTRKEKLTTRRKTTTTSTPESSTKANISIWTAPGDIINVQSQRLSNEESSLEAGGMVGLVVSFVLVFIAGLIAGLFICRRRYRKRYEESLNVGFNNVLYTAAPARESKVKDTNILSVAEDCTTDEEVDHKYVDIDEVASGHCVDLPACKDINGPVDVSCLKENIYDTVTTHEEAGHGQGGTCGVEAPPPCPGGNLGKFAPEFLKKDTDVSQAYSNNLYGYSK